MRQTLSEAVGDLEEAIRWLESARDTAYEASGAEPSQEPVPEVGFDGSPGCDGWPLAIEVSGEIDTIIAAARRILAREDVAQACHGEREAEDDRESPEAMG